MYISTPKRDAIFRHLLELIRDQKLGTDGLIPTELSMAKNFKATRADVQLVMRELQQQRLVSRRQGHGTRVNPAASPQLVENLLGQLSRQIGVILPHDMSAYNDPHWDRSTVQAIESTLRDEGYGLSFYAFDANLPANALADALRTKRQRPIAGLILLPSYENRHQWLAHSDVLKESGLPICVLDAGDFSIDTWRFHKVRHDPFDEGEVLARYLEMKLKRAVVVAEKESHLEFFWVQERLRGIRKEAVRIGLEPRGIEVKLVDAALAMLSNKVDGEPPVLVCLNDEVANKCLKLATEKGLVAGTDFEVIGFDNDVRYWTSNLTTVAHQYVRDGEIMAQLLLDVLHGHYQNGLTTICAQPQVIERYSCRRQAIGNDTPT